MTELVISCEIDGIHSWPKAPEKYKEFSRPHRHLFKVICWYPIGDSTDPTRREKELWELREQTINFLYSQGLPVKDNCINFGSMSCEGIADLLKEKMGFSKVFVGEEYWLGAVIT